MNNKETAGEAAAWPEVGSTWLHTNGNRYTVTGRANEDATRADYPPVVLYRGEDGKHWAKPLAEWHRSRTLIASASNTEDDAVGVPEAARRVLADARPFSDITMLVPECTLRLLREALTRHAARERGANSGIAMSSEFEHRLETLRSSLWSIVEHWKRRADESEYGPAYASCADEIKAELIDDAATPPMESSTHGRERAALREIIAVLGPEPPSGLSSGAAWEWAKALQVAKAAYAAPSASSSAAAGAVDDRASLYLRGGCTDNDCRLCFMDQWERKPGMAHAGISPYGEPPALTANGEVKE